MTDKAISALSSTSLVALTDRILLNQDAGAGAFNTKTEKVGDFLAAVGLSGANKIINGDMRIDQRNAGASVNIGTANPQYIIDRWGIQANLASKLSAQRNGGAVTPPAGFSNYFAASSSSAYSITSTDYFSIQQKIEGANIADLSFGTASAKSVTLSFWARSSLTGTFGGALCNGNGTRAYPFLFTISAANTWTFITLLIPGDTTGTWVTTNATGMMLSFGLGVGSGFSTTAAAWAAGNYLSATGGVSLVGTNGATFYVTGVKLEAGAVATPFVPDDYAVAWAKCQRYFQKYTTASQAYLCMGSVYAITTLLLCPFTLRAAMRGSPTLTTGGTISGFVAGVAVNSSSIAIGNDDDQFSLAYLSVQSGSSFGTAGQSGPLLLNSAGAFVAFDAEL